VIEQWIIGDRTIPISGFSGTFYYFGRHSYQPPPLGGVPTMDLTGQWLLGRMRHRYGDDLHGYYRSMTADPALDLYTVGAAPGVAQNLQLFDPTTGVATTFVTVTQVGSPDGVVVIGRDTMLSHLMLSNSTVDDFVPFREDPWVRETDIVYTPTTPYSRSADWTFTLNSHPEWNNLHYPRRSSAPSTSTLAHSQQLFLTNPKPALTVTEPDFGGRTMPHQRVFPIQEIVTTYTFLPKVTELPLNAGGTSHALVLGAPCGYASCPDNLEALLGTVLAVDPNDPYPIDPVTGQVYTSSWGDNYHYLPIPAAYNATFPWDAQYRRGFVSLWQFSGTPAFPTPDPNPLGGNLGVDPWSRARRATDPTPPDSWHLSERPAGSPDLDPLFLDGHGSSAFQLHFVKLFDNASVERTFALVVDFAGTIQAFDITDLLLVSSGRRTPFDTWEAPVDPLELRRPNLFDVATDITSDPGRANVYVPCSRGGVQIVAFDADFGFVGDDQRLVTPGAPHSVTVRATSQGRLLLVDDQSAGYRFYRKP